MVDLRHADVSCGGDADFAINQGFVTALRMKPFPLTGETILKRNRRQISSLPIQGEPTMIRTFALATIAASALSLFALPTQSYAFSPEAQQMCTGDALRLCSAEIPDIPRITACMMKQRMSLSAGCRAVMDRDLAQSASK
jgi:hypothetical protein